MMIKLAPNSKPESPHQEYAPKRKRQQRLTSYHIHGRQEEAYHNSRANPYVSTGRYGKAASTRKQQARASRVPPRAPECDPRTIASLPSPARNP